MRDHILYRRKVKIHWPIGTPKIRRWELVIDPPGTKSMLFDQDAEQHTLQGLELSNPNRVAYLCSCGSVGFAGRAYPDEDLQAKAKLNHSQHAKYAKQKLASV